jgi:uncharacterized protein (DUF1501 family)
MTSRKSIIERLDGNLRVASPLGKLVEDYGAFAGAAESLTYNPSVQRAFSFTQEESQRYGSTGFGNACLLAQKVIAADLGTRFVQITGTGWDMHQDIYAKERAGLYTKAKELDTGMAAMLSDLKQSGSFDNTLVVMLGEFGRTVGPLTATQGRDHYLQHFAVFAGAGIKGGRTIGSTDQTGASTVDPGWSRNRDIKPEDVEATIYSALGINWTNVRYDDPFGRGFEYVPYARKEDLYGPINELWG